MTDIRKEPCSACPYRRDVPSGVWAAPEYDKLTDYDAETPYQPTAPFACHATPDHYCHGWAVVHTSRGREFDLLALRIAGFDGEIPSAGVPLFASGAEASEHGKADIAAPSPEAQATARRLMRKYERLQDAS